MNTRRAACVVLLTLAALTAGCSSDNSDHKATPAASSAPAPETTSAEPTPIEPDILSLGDTWEWEGTDEETGETLQGAVTVLGYKQGVKATVSADEEFNTDGYVWAALELKTCSTRGRFLATTEPWTLSYDDGTRIEPSSSTYDDFPRPEFPFETQLTSGKCVKGNVVYPVPGDQQPASVVYAPQGLDTPTEWTIPKA